MGGDPIIQVDIEKTINQIRKRPLDETAIKKGLQQTAPMMLSDITADFDPNRDKGNLVAGDYEVCIRALPFARFETLEETALYEQQNISGHNARLMGEP